MAADAKSYTYTDVLKHLRAEVFSGADLSNTDRLVNWLRLFINELGPGWGSGPRNRGARINPLEMRIQSEPLLEKQTVAEHLRPFFANVPKSGHPHMLKNINPACSVPAVAASALADLFMPNSSTEDMSGNLSLIEVGVASEIGRLFGIREGAAGFFTFGGTSTIANALRIALLKVDPSARERGIREADRMRIIAPRAAHEALDTSAMWLGLGSQSVVRVPVQDDMATNYSALASLTRDVIRDGCIPVMMQASCGTTSNFAIDDIGAVLEIRDGLCEEFGITPSIHLHVDSVAGWIYALFKDYDFELNPLSIPAAPLRQISQACRLLLRLHEADSFGLDFHKTGFTAYPSSLFLARNLRDISLLEGSKIQVPHLYSEGTIYNPCRFTLETSRSAADALGIWTTLLVLGIDGLRSLWVNALSVGDSIEKELIANRHHGFVIQNSHRFGPDVLVRVYPPGTPLKDIRRAEDDDKTLRSQNSEYLRRFHAWLAAGHEKDDEGIAIGLTRSSRFTSQMEPVDGLRFYPLSPYACEATAAESIQRIVEFKRQFDQLGG